MKTVLTIAGSDCSGGAGIQADLKTIAAHKLYGMSVITSLTAQNTTGVYGIEDVNPDFVAKQLDCVFEDIFPDAVKIGMISNKDICEVIIDKIHEYKPNNIVIDPVMVSTSKNKLLKDNSLYFLIDKLLPLGTIITPNIPEAEIISGYIINNSEQMLTAAKKIFNKLKCPVLLKGGHSLDNSDDLLYNTGTEWLKASRINNPNNHGTGCTLSSAIACNLATGYNLSDSVKNAKKYVYDALSAQLNLGNGCGPINHMF